MFSIKPISPDSIAGALAKAERYRLLNEPDEAESICRDILTVDPGNQQARVSLLLALTDQIPQNQQRFPEAVKAAEVLEAAYDRAYYAGVAWERRARALYHRAGAGDAWHVYEWILTAMNLFEAAERLRTPGNDDALLRWNTCVRFLAAHSELGPHEEEAVAAILSE